MEMPLDIPLRQERRLGYPKKIPHQDEELHAEEEESVFFTDKTLIIIWLITSHLILTVSSVQTFRMMSPS